MPENDQSSLGVHRVVLSQSQRIELEQAFWRVMREAAEADDIRAFYSHYAAYLSFVGAISPGRQLLQRMAVRVKEVLS
jgi:hypothetical protein